MKRFLFTFWVIWTFSWEPVQNATGYYLYYYKSSSTIQQVVKKICPTTQCSVSVDGRYSWWFYVTAYNAEKESTHSDMIRIYRGVEKERRR